MNFKFTIAKKLVLGFGIITVALFINILLINSNLKKSLEINQEISTVYDPSANLLAELSNMLVTSKMLIKNWVYVETQTDNNDKIQLRELYRVNLPKLNEQILNLSHKWADEEKESYEQIYVSISDTLFIMHQNIMNKLSTSENYSNTEMLRNDIYPKIEDGGEIIILSDNIIEQLENLVEIHKSKVENARQHMDDSFRNLENFIFASGVILVFISIIIALILAQIVIKPIKKIKNVLIQMGNGEMPKKQIKERNDEIGEMAAALNALIMGLKETTDFSIEIGKGNFESPFVPLSEEDNLGNALLEMRTNLKHATEEETRRKKEDDQRNWASQGIAKYSDILRQNNDDIEKLSYEIISNLVKYCDANQGGLFVVNNDDEKNVFIEMSAAYAFDRKKFLENKIELGVGLIGRAVQEAETIYITDIPENYITITSGLGDESPKSILIVPLVINEIVYGVIEMASFKEFEKYQIEFVEKVGENIASTLSTVKVNIRTTNLLEQTRQQAEEMRAQEEEMRQNMEELQATQEESARREAELEKQVDEFKKFKKQQESFIKKLDGNLTGGLVSALDEDEDENETKKEKKKK
ncbi:MAG: GAF domain-containing protein [Bacteroidales bacterium]|jgi:methyl-accepting chemotaxis protein|nr:GAF domain-containing protein [Bacteroidales bacterium]